MIFPACQGIRLLPQLCQEIQKRYDLHIEPSMSLQSDLCFNNAVYLGGRHLAHCSFDSYSSVTIASALFNTNVGCYSAIGDQCTIGLPQASSTVLSASLAHFIPDLAPSDSLRQTTVFLGHDVWIGTSVVIAEHVSIGTGSIIGAGAVITKDVEPYTIVVGHDRVIRRRFPDELAQDLLDAQWWKYDLPRMLERGDELHIHEPALFLHHLKESDPASLLRLPCQWMRLTPTAPESCNLQKLTKAPE